MCNTAPQAPQNLIFEIWVSVCGSKGHEVLRGAVDKVALDALNNMATLCSATSVLVAIVAWLSFLTDTPILVIQ